jgi:hypothetical protein
MYIFVIDQEWAGEQFSALHAEDHSTVRSTWTAKGPTEGLYDVPVENCNLYWRDKLRTLGIPNAIRSDV